MELNTASGAFYITDLKTNKINLTKNSEFEVKIKLILIIFNLQYRRNIHTNTKSLQ